MVMHYVYDMQKLILLNDRASNFSIFPLKTFPLLFFADAVHHKNRRQGLATIIRGGNRDIHEQCCLRLRKLA